MMMMEGMAAVPGCNSKGCKWCAQGQCWKAGQVPMDPNYVPKPGMPKQVKKKHLKQSAQPGMAQFSVPGQFSQFAQQFGQQQGFGAAPMQAGQAQDQHMLQLLTKMMQMNGARTGGQQGALGMQQTQQKQPDVQGDQSKELLHAFVRNMTGKHPTRSEILYSTMEVPMQQPPQFISHVVLLSIDPSRTYSGEPMPNQMDAERSAARAALTENGQGVPLNPLGLTGQRSGGKGAKGASASTGPGITGLIGGISVEFKPGAGKTKKKKKPSKCNASCKWCKLGTCYKSGQVPPPEGVEVPGSLAQFPGSVLM